MDSLLVAWSNFFLRTNFIIFSKLKEKEQFGKNCVSNVNTTNLAILLEKFTKFSISQNWKKKKKKKPLLLSCIT
jgi:hypothetical protein